MNKFKIEIASVPDKENLVAEIWYVNNLIAEISQVKGCFKLELYPTEKVKFELEEYLIILKSAKKKLIGSED